MEIFLAKKEKEAKIMDYNYSLNVLGIITWLYESMHESMLTGMLTGNIGCIRYCEKDSKAKTLEASSANNKVSIDAAT